MKYHLLLPSTIISHHLPSPFITFSPPSTIITHRCGCLPRWRGRHLAEGAQQFTAAGPSLWRLPQRGVHDLRVTGRRLSAVGGFMGDGEPPR